MKFRALPIWRRRRFALAAAKRFWSLGTLPLLSFWFSATATSNFDAWRYLVLGAIATAHFGIYVFYEALALVRTHHWALMKARRKAALKRYIAHG